MSEFGEMVRRHRRAKDISQEDLASAVGCSNQHISLIENGARPGSRDVAAALHAELVGSGPISLDRWLGLHSVARGRLDVSHLPAGDGDLVQRVVEILGGSDEDRRSVLLSQLRLLVAWEVD